MPNTYFVIDPGSGNDITAAVQAQVNNCAASGDTIIVPGTMRPFLGQIRTSKRFKMFTLTPATAIWSGFSNNFLPESPLSVAPSCIWYRPESMSDSTLKTGGGGGDPMSFIRFDDPAGSAPTSPTTDGFVISDIELRSKLPSRTGMPAASPPVPVTDGLSIAPDYGIWITKSVDFQITRCVFKYFGTAAIRYDHWDTVARGLVYKNYFDNCSKGADGLGLGYAIVVYGQNIAWNYNPKFGTDNFLFIENNYFTYSRHAVAGGGMGRYVIRYNYAENNIITEFSSNQTFDAHGRRGGGGDNQFATHAVECYNNKIVNTKFRDGSLIATNPNGLDSDGLMERGIHLKECMHLAYNNIITGCRFGVGQQIETIDIYGTGNTGYPQIYTMGAASAATGGSANPNGDLSDSWIWNNSFTVFDAYCSNNYNYTPTIFANGRDFHLTPYAYLNADSAGTGTAYTYPHPLRDDLITPPVVGSGRRRFHTRTQHAKR